MPIFYLIEPLWWCCPSYLYYYCCCDLSIIYMILHILLLLLFLFQQSIMIMIIRQCCCSLWNGLGFPSQVIAGRSWARRSLGSLGRFVLCSAETDSAVTWLSQWFLCLLPPVCCYEPTGGRRGPTSPAVLTQCL